jgi:hypothetical protein
MIATRSSADAGAEAPRKDIPVTMSGPMVRAILDGRKITTRRLAWREDKVDGWHEPSSWQRVQDEDRLWVRESLTCAGDGVWRREADNSKVTVALGDPQLSTMIDWAHHQDRSKWAFASSPHPGDRLASPNECLAS